MLCGLDSALFEYVIFLCYTLKYSFNSNRVLDKICVSINREYIKFDVNDQLLFRKSDIELFFNEFLRQ